MINETVSAHQHVWEYWYTQLALDGREVVVEHCTTPGCQLRREVEPDERHEPV